MEPFDREHPHRPYYREREGADTIVIFIHGFFGSPSQFWELSAIAWEKGYSIASLLLPGHGGSGREFTRTPGRQWVRFAMERIRYYAGQYKHVLLVGHSMGGLVSLHASLFPDTHVSGVFLLNTPLSIHLTARGTANGLKAVFAPQKYLDVVSRSYREVNSVDRMALPQYLRMLPRVADLQRLMDRVREELAQVRVPVTIIQSRRDETVRWRSAVDLSTGMRQAPCRVVWLRNSWHSYYISGEKEVVEREFVYFLERTCQKRGAEREEGTP